MIGQAFALAADLFKMLNEITLQKLENCYSAHIILFQI